MDEAYPEMSVFGFSEWLRANGMHDALYMFNSICHDAPNWAFRDLNKMKKWVASNKERSQILKDIVAAYNGLNGKADSAHLPEHEQIS